MCAKKLLLPTSLGVLLMLTACTSKPQTYTGVVTTTMCGTTHFSGMTPAECVRKCIKDGSQYALAVGDKVYKLDGNLAGIDKYAGEKASVFGSARRSTIRVSSVFSPKQ